MQLYKASEKAGADGVMIGRGAYGRPWLLGQVMHWWRTGEKLDSPDFDEQYLVVVEHYRDMLDHYGRDVGARIARKHLGWYTKGMHGSAEFRNHVNFIDDPDQVLGEIERLPEGFRQALAEHVELMTALMSETPEEADAALADLAQMVGGLAVARALGPGELSDRVLRAAKAAVNSLTISGPAVSFDGTTDNGLFVRGATTLAGNTLLAVNRPVGLGGRISGTGTSVVTKVGAGLLYLTNSDAGAGANAGIARWEILRDTGALEVRMADGTTSNPLVDGSTVVISGSGLLNLRHEGNNIETYQRITTFQTNNLQFGSLAGAATRPAHTWPLTPWSSRPRSSWPCNPSWPAR